MPPMISIGSTGPVVSQLQQSLNLLPTELKRLIEDGIFGQMTQARVIEFQKLNDLSPDGIVGPLTWDLLVQLVAEVTGDFKNELARMAIVGIAKAEASLGGVYATMSGGHDPQHTWKVYRLGYRRLLKYFRISAPKPGAFNRSAIDEDAIRYLTTPGSLSPMPSWCGIFALWAIKTAGLQVGNWVVGHGIRSVDGFHDVVDTKRVGAGDIGFLPNDHKHHFIIEQVVNLDGVPTALTIEGNIDPGSRFAFKQRPLTSIGNFYTCFDR